LQLDVPWRPPASNSSTRTAAAQGCACVSCQKENNGSERTTSWEGVESGRWFESGEAKNGAQVALLGQTVAKQLFPDVDPIGREVRIKNVPFRVIGMLTKRPVTAGQDQDDALIVPLNAGRRVPGSNQAKFRSVAAILVIVAALNGCKDAHLRALTLCVKAT
jgi:hypothetical protein